MIDTQKKESFIELRAAGLSFDTIAQQLDISKPTLIKLSRELSADIEKLKFINLEAIAERHKALRAERLDSLGRLLDKVSEAIERADFSKVPVERLIELQFKLTDRLRAEISEPFTIERGSLTQIFSNDSASDYNMKID